MNRFLIVAIAAGPETRNVGDYIFGLVVLVVWIAIECAFATYFYYREKRLLWEYDHYERDGSL